MFPERTAVEEAVDATAAAAAAAFQSRFRDRLIACKRTSVCTYAWYASPTAITQS